MLPLPLSIPLSLSWTLCADTPYRVVETSGYPTHIFKRLARLRPASPDVVTGAIRLASSRRRIRAQVVQKSNGWQVRLGGRESIFFFSHTKSGLTDRNLAHEWAVAGGTRICARWSYERGAPSGLETKPDPPAECTVVVHSSACRRCPSGCRRWRRRLGLPPAPAASPLENER